MKSVYTRELKSYFTSFMGYVFIAFIMLAVGIYSWFINFLNQSPNFEYVVYNLNFIFLIAVPIITMRVFTEEKKQKTDMLLYSLPLKSSEIVLGKFFALITLMLISTVLICILPLILSIFGSISLMTSYSTITGFFLLGTALISIGVFVSAATDNQIVAAATTFTVLFISYLSSTIANGISTSAFSSFVSFCVISVLIALFAAIITKNISFGIIIACILCTVTVAIYLFFPTVMEGALQNTLQFISLFDRLSYFVTGVFDLTSVFYYLSITVMFIVLSTLTFEKRRWC